MRIEAVTAEQVEVMEKVIKKMRKVFNPLDFPNPKLASHWAAVEALAFNKSDPEPFVDSAREYLYLEHFSWVRRPTNI